MYRSRYHRPIIASLPAFALLLSAFTGCDDEEAFTSSGAGTTTAAPTGTTTGGGTVTGTASGTGSGVGGDVGGGGPGGTGGAAGGAGGATGGAGGSVGGAGGATGGAGGATGGAGGATGGAGGATGGSGGSGSPTVADHLLISEVVVTPSEGEYIEIHNPTGAVIDLTDYYLTDGTNAAPVQGRYYYNIVLSDQTLSDSGYSSDFHARFPTGASIGPGAYQTIALRGSSDYETIYSASPTYEFSDDVAGTGGGGGSGGGGGAGGGDDGTPDMLEAHAGSIGGAAGLTDGHELVVLYRWNGVQDLVEDVDYVVWGDKSEAVDKSGISIDSGFDGDAATSSYLSETSRLNQAVCSTGSHTQGNSFSRIDDTEGAEVGSGNGITGDNETSENLDATWDECTVSPLAQASCCP